MLTRRASNLKKLAYVWSEPSWTWTQGVNSRGPAAVATSFSLRSHHVTGGMTSSRHYTTGGANYVTDLPKLPVPPLKQTMKTFLKTVRPLVSSETEFKRISKLAAEFAEAGSDGEKLQKLLEDRAKHKESWLAEWWDDCAYLDFREPNALLVSPGASVQYDDTRKTVEEQLRLASKVVVGQLFYKQKMDRGEVPQDMFGSEPLCMAQYAKTWSVCRIPQRKRDRIHYPQPGYQSRNIIVLRNNHIFSVDVYDEHMSPLSPDHVYQQLKKVTEQSSEAGPGIGIMTAENRDTWADVYEELLADPENKAHLNSINNSLFAVCLDDDVPGIEDNDVRIGYALHGSGSSVAACNRWFDKILQLVITKDGLLAFTAEHSTSDGPPLGAAVENMMYFVDNEWSVNSGSPVSEPKRLEFNLNQTAHESIANAKQSFDKLVSNLELHREFISEFGKNVLKEAKVSPDAFVQVSLQLAYYRLHGVPAPTYESGSSRRFALGRTETIRSCSIASLAYCQAMSGDGVATDRDKVRLLRSATDAHSAYTKMILYGNGIDRHLLGLKLTAQEHGLPLPELLTDPVTIESGYWRLSTSQQNVSTGGAFSFAPVVPDGYGLCYSIRKDDISLNISSWKSCPETNHMALSRTLHQALLDGRDLLVGSRSQPIDGSRL